LPIQSSDQKAASNVWIVPVRKETFLGMATVYSANVSVMQNMDITQTDENGLPIKVA
jgi:hypothetical protein